MLWPRRRLSRCRRPARVAAKPPAALGASPHRGAALRGSRSRRPPQPPCRRSRRPGRGTTDAGDQASAPDDQSGQRRSIAVPSACRRFMSGRPPLLGRLPRTRPVVVGAGTWPEAAAVPSAGRSRAVTVCEPGARATRPGSRPIGSPTRRSSVVGAGISGPGGGLRAAAAPAGPATSWCWTARTGSAASWRWSRSAGLHRRCAAPRRCWPVGPRRSTWPGGRAWADDLVHAATTLGRHLVPGPGRRRCPPGR